MTLLIRATSCFCICECSESKTAKHKGAIILKCVANVASILNVKLSYLSLVGYIYVTHSITIVGVLYGCFKYM